MWWRHLAAVPCAAVRLQLAASETGSVVSGAATQVAPLVLARLAGSVETSVPVSSGCAGNKRVTHVAVIVHGESHACIFVRIDNMPYHNKPLLHLHCIQNVPLQDVGKFIQPGPKTIKKSTNSTQNKSQTQRLVLT